MELTGAGIYSFREIILEGGHWQYLESTRYRSIDLLQGGQVTNAKHKRSAISTISSQEAHSPHPENNYVSSSASKLAPLSPSHYASSGSILSLVLVPGTGNLDPQTSLRGKDWPGAGITPAHCRLASPNRSPIQRLESSLASSLVAQTGRMNGCRGAAPITNRGKRATCFCGLTFDTDDDPVYLLIFVLAWEQKTQKGG